MAPPRSAQSTLGDLDEAKLEIQPCDIRFSARVGQDVPFRCTLFNPHPMQRLSYKFKTTSSASYRAWPNCGALEPGATQRVQILLLGTQVDLLQPQVVEECNMDRFQLQYMPLADGAEYNDSLFKLHPHLVQDTLLNVSVVVVSTSAPGSSTGEQVTAWEGMVRVSLLRMLADEERDPAHDATCLNKFTELLLLNGIIDTQQMWEALSLVANMYECMQGPAAQAASNVEAWLEAVEPPKAGAALEMWLEGAEPPSPRSTCSSRGQPPAPGSFEDVPRGLASAPVSAPTSAAERKLFGCTSFPSPVTAAMLCAAGRKLSAASSSRPGTPDVEDPRPRAAGLPAGAQATAEGTAEGAAEAAAVHQPSDAAALVGGTGARGGKERASEAAGGDEKRGVDSGMSTKQRAFASPQKRQTRTSKALFQAAIPAQPASYDYGSVRSTSVSTRVPQGTSAWDSSAWEGPGGARQSRWPRPAWTDTPSSSASESAALSEGHFLRMLEEARRPAAQRQHRAAAPRQARPHAFNPAQRAAMPAQSNAGSPENAAPRPADPAPSPEAALPVVLADLVQVADPPQVAVPTPQEASPVQRPVSCIPLPTRLSTKGKALPGGSAAIDGGSGGQVLARRPLVDGEVSAMPSDSAAAAAALKSPRWWGRSVAKGFRGLWN